MGIFTILLALIYVFCLSFSFIAERCGDGTTRCTNKSPMGRDSCLSSLSARGM